MVIDLNRCYEIYSISISSEISSSPASELIHNQCSSPPPTTSGLKMLLWAAILLLGLKFFMKLKLLQSKVEKLVWTLVGPLLALILDYKNGGTELKSAQKRCYWPEVITGR